MVDAHHHVVRPESGMPLDLLVFLKLAAAMSSAGHTALHVLQPASAPHNALLVAGLHACARRGLGGIAFWVVAPHDAC